MLHGLFLPFTCQSFLLKTSFKQVNFDLLKIKTSMKNLFRAFFYFAVDTFQQILLTKTMSSYELEGFVDFTTSSHFHRHFKIRVPFSLGRSVRGLRFSRSSDKDIFSKLVSDVIDNKDLDSLSQFLYGNYAKYKLLTSADVASLPENKLLCKYPSWALVLPWEDQTIQDKFHNYIDYFIENRSADGLISIDSYQHPDISSILYSYAGASSQVSQTYRLYNSFKKHGILKSGNLPVIDILVNETGWRWMMSCSGNHRAYLMFHMGYEYFDSRIGVVVNKKNSRNWPNVRNSLYTIEEAEYLFDLAFQGHNSIRGIV